MLRLSYFDGNYFPLGGSQMFANELATRFQELGGSILMRSMVRRIHVTKSRATSLTIDMGGVKSQRRISVSADCIVAGGDMRRTVFEMVGSQHFPTTFVEQLNQLEPSFSCFLCHIGVRDVPTELLERVHGYYWQDWNSDRVGHEAFRFKLFVPTLYEPNLAPTGCHILIVQKVVDFDYDSVTDWAEHKQEIERFVLNGLRELIPGLDEKIVTCECASARTSHRFTLNYQGAMLGWRMSPEQLGEHRPSVESPVPGLFFVGQWTRPGGGITPTIVSAMNVAQKVTGQKFNRQPNRRPDRESAPTNFNDAVEVTL